MLRRDHFGYACDRGIAGIDISPLIERHEIGLHELPQAGPTSVADCAPNVALPIDLEHLPVITTRDPRRVVEIEINRADQVSHRYGFYKLSSPDRKSVG